MSGNDNTPCLRVLPTPLFGLRRRSTAATPRSCSSITRASCVAAALQGEVASGVRVREQRLLLARLRVGNRGDAFAAACGDEARGHELAQQGGSRCNDDIDAGTAGGNVLPPVADHDTLPRPA